MRSALFSKTLGTTAAFARERDGHSRKSGKFFPRKSVTNIEFAFCERIFLQNLIKFRAVGDDDIALSYHGYGNVREIDRDPERALRIFSKQGCVLIGSTGQGRGSYLLRNVF